MVATAVHVVTAPESLNAYCWIILQMMDFVHGHIKGDQFFKKLVHFFGFLRACDSGKSLEKRIKKSLIGSKDPIHHTVKNLLTKPQNAVLLFITGYIYGSSRASILIGRTDPFVVLR